MPILQQSSGLDDIPQWDATQEFSGGQVSFMRANLLKANQCALLENMDIALTGELITRRGIQQLGDTLFDDLEGGTYYKTPTSEELIVSVQGLLRSYNGAAWGLAGGIAQYISSAAPAVFVQGVDILYIAQRDSVLRRYSSGVLTSYSTVAISEVTLVEVSVTAASLANKYFRISDETGTVGVWFNLDGLGADPMGGARSIEVIIATGASTAAITNAINVSVNADAAGKFSSVITDTNKCHITCVLAGARLDGTPATSGLTVTTETQGRDLNQLPPANAALLAWHTDRLIASGVQTAPDTIYFSQFLDASIWDQTNWSLRVGSGDGDPITAIVPWTNYNLIVVKQHSTWVVNCNPNLAVADFTIQRIHDRIGSFSPNTWCQVGTDLFGLTDSGVRSIKNIIASEQQKEVGPPISYPVQDVMDRINPSALSTACAFHWNNRYILGIPIDGANEPNYVLVFNTNTETWSGGWTGWAPLFFSARIDAGVPKLWMGRSNGTLADWLDFIPISQETNLAFQDMGQGYPSRILTRAFTCNEPACRKTGFNSELEFNKSSADVTAKLVLDDSSAQAWQQFSTLQNSLTLPLTLPFTLPRAGIVRKAFDLMAPGQWRELQIDLSTTSGKLALRSIAISAFLDTVELQS